jgi:hypothetical protein
LLNIAHETRQRLANQFLGDMGNGIGMIDLVLHIVTRSGGSELEGGRVLLGMELQALYLFGALIQSKVTRSAPSASSIKLANNDSYGIPVTSNSVTTDHYKTTHIGTYENIGANPIGVT